jgi:integrase/recombinase XerD
VAGYLGRFKGESRVHAASDLTAFLGWCSTEGLEPLAVEQVGRAQVEAFVPWMQEAHRYSPRRSGAVCR